VKQSFTAAIWTEGPWHIAQCREVDVVSQGESEEEALQNLREALRLHFSPPTATLLPRVRPLEVEMGAA
jgi:predicted RNase H-like HicB family nuclease